MNSESTSRFARFAGHMEGPEAFFQPISSEEYPRYGIDPEDVPMGTFAAKDHPSFLPSRFGGNAYGLGLIELRVLNRADTRFMEGLDFKNPSEVGRHFKRLNAIYRKLGLLIRFTSTGMRYFLIPINLVAHSLEDIRSKADEIEALVREHFPQAQPASQEVQNPPSLPASGERLNIGLMIPGHDIFVHELTARLSSHRIFMLESLDKLNRWRTPLDMIVLPNDFSEFFSEDQIHGIVGKTLDEGRFFHFVRYLSEKVYDLLEQDGKFVILTHSYCPDAACGNYKVHFKSDEERKSFLIFSHIFKTEKKYDSEALKEAVNVPSADLCRYLNRFALSEAYLTGLLSPRKLADLDIEEIDDLAYLDIRMSRGHMSDPENQSVRLLEPYFETVRCERKSLEYHHKYWEGRLELDRELPECLLLYVGKPRRPLMTQQSLEEGIKDSGLMGCSLSLVAEYRNTFRYVLDVLKILQRVRSNTFPQWPELEKTRLRNPFEWERGRSKAMDTVISLIDQIGELEELHACLNPDGIEGPATPVLENLAKMSLHGFTEDQLRETLLIVVGHTSMSRVVFGKLPSKTLKTITDQAREGSYQKSVDLLRFCRLMSMAEIGASFGDAFSIEHGKELFQVYQDAIQVATEPGMDWERLNDHQISALGGVRNKAVREMLKFFNLFEFLNNWQEFQEKGSCRKEVLCDYDPRMLDKLEQALDLARIAEFFNRRFLHDRSLGKSYFFRQLLNTEFHGIGHLFPKLGPRAGFVLLWIGVNAAEKHILNFNPILAKIPRERHEKRIAKVRKILLQIPVDQLCSEFLEEIKSTLSQGRSAFIFDSGIRLKGNSQTWAVDVSFVDVEENIRQIKALVKRFESSHFRDMALWDFREMERLFSELESFCRYLRFRREDGCPTEREGDRGEACSELVQADRVTRTLSFSKNLEARIREIEKIEERLKSIFLSQILMPHEIHDVLGVLAWHCPEVLRFVLPEFHSLGNLVENWPTRRRQSLGFYAMRCLQKFQALITQDREAFQDLSAFYQLAKHELGPLAEEGCGATPAQMEILEGLVNRIKQDGDLHQAFTLALLFQDIGKIDKYVEAFSDCALCTHAEKGAIILKRSDLLEKYRLKPQVKELMVSLVRYHGLVGHMIQGEEPVVSLEHLVESRDALLLDAYVLHSILAAAAVQEDLMTADLLDVFLRRRDEALKMISSRKGCREWLQGSLRERGRTMLEEFESPAESFGVCPLSERRSCIFPDRGGEEDKALWQGRQISAFERLLRLMDVPFIDYQDLQMYLLGMPATFIHHKKGLKSLGQASFEAQLEKAAEVFDAASSLEVSGYRYLLYCLDPLGGAFRIYDFYPLPRFLDTQESLKLLLISFRHFHRHVGTDVGGGLISFRGLSQNVERRPTAFRNALKSLPLLQTCPGREASPPSTACLGLTFHVSVRELSMGLHFEDDVHLDEMTDALESARTHEELQKRYRAFMEELQRQPYETSDYEQQLTRFFKNRREKINDLILEDFQETLERIDDFDTFEKVRDEVRAWQGDLDFSEGQQLVLKEILEHHRERIRSHYLDEVYCNIHECESSEALLSYWDRLKRELWAYRLHVGKEYESFIADFIDEKLLEID